MQQQATASSRARTSLVTGGSRGIGRSTALALADQGHDVVITYISDRKAADEVVGQVSRRGRRAAALRLDVGAIASFDEFVTSLRRTLREWDSERLDDLVNNAGTGDYASFEATAEAAFDALFAVHVKGPFFLTQKLLPLLAEGGRIVNVSSGLSRYVYPGFAAYSMAKGAIDVLTRALAVELGPRGIAVNVVAPGGVATDFGGGAMRDPELSKQVAAETPLGRVGQPEDIAAIIAALLSLRMGWATGQRIEATGGYRL